MHIRTTAISIFSLHDALPISTEKPLVSPGSADRLRTSTRRASEREMASTICGTNTCGNTEENQDPGPKVMMSASLRACSARRSEEHTSELQSRGHLVCRLLIE